MKQLVYWISQGTARSARGAIARIGRSITGAFCCLIVGTIALTNAANAQQCNDGIDNDGDGKIDALVELNPANGARLTVGGAGDPPAVRAAIDAAIVAKKLPYARPTRDNILRSDRASWSATGTSNSGVEDIATLTGVCRILGYRDYVSSTCRDSERSSRYPNGKCNYHSPSNNILWRFRNSTFIAESANPKYSKTYLATITCMNKLPACSDGWDNDGDGLVDRADGGCASDNDTSEVAHDPTCTTPSSPSEFEITQCSDGKDNDGDGLTDLNDPGCPNKQGNNESSATTQCQDGIDNDGDGAKDYPADFSCSSRTDNDETNPKSQCQDGIDNDGDGLTDLSDPGCPNNQGNNEGCATTQCQDGIDNDGDGATDYPADFSCSSPTDNDETNPKAQCQDGIDNDGDGFTDLKDPGCKTSQGNNEAAGTTQCQDGIDNDGDGATDFGADFSCSSPADNDESNPKAQCQDGIDNDGDGFVDLKDPGCPSKQGNNEGSGTSQCQNKKDDDGDGLIDLLDPGCVNPQDPDESNVTAQCQDKIDNDGDGLIDYPQDKGCSSATDNDEFDAPPACKDGKDNDGDSLIDYPADPGCSDAEDTDESNPTAPRITPIAECVDVNADGSIAARFGYINESPVASSVPVGNLNFFTPGSQNRGQPEAFFPGRGSNVLTVTIPAGQSVSWVVGQSTATASSSTTRCQADILGCIDTDNMPTLSMLDRLARSQRTNILRITQRVTKRKTSGSSAQQAEKLSTQAKALYLEQWADIWGSFPQISTACAGCASVDVSGEVEQVLSRAQRMNRIARQAALLLQRGRRGKLSADERGLISASGQIYDQFVQTTQTLPRFTSLCK